MQQQKRKKWKSYLILLLWVVVIQAILVNISAALYAYKFTHFYTNPPPYQPTSNVFQKTWKLFTGPKVYKLTNEYQPPFPCQQVKLTVSDNIQIDGWYSERKSAKGCAIFFHGVTSNKSTLLSEAAALRNWGYNVLLIDFRGHGKSTGKKSSFGVTETEEVEKAFRFAQSKGAKKIILYGVSLGSVVILKAVSEKKVAPDAIIADMPFNGLKDHFKARARTIGFPAQPFGSLVSFWVGIQNGYNGFAHNAADYAAGVSCPVLMQWGNQDSYVTKEETYAVYNALKSPIKKLAVYQGANHEALINYDPKTWRSELSRFLSKVQL